MPFPVHIRDEALVRAARYCCVCRQFKGRNIEVHHVVQEADGGENNLDNAIPLCADCHADAGHYNPRHPRGTKFSPSELRKARDRWYQIVARGPVPIVEAGQPLHSRYLICKSFEAIQEIAGEDLSNFPVRNAMLVRSPIHYFVARAVELHKKKWRHSRQFGASFQSEEDFLRAYPDARKIASSTTQGYQWLHYARRPTKEELQKVVGPEDFVTRTLLELGVPPEELCRVDAQTDECGGVLLQEEYKLRTLCVAYLVVTNVSDSRVRLVALQGDLRGRSDFGSLEGFASAGLGGEANETQLPLPAVEVAPDHSVVVPVATVLGPFGGLPEQKHWGGIEHLADGQAQETSYAHLERGNDSQWTYWGPVLLSPKIALERFGVRETVNVHELDLGNVYVLGRFWEMGSCPHLFAITSGGAVTYIGEIFVGAPGELHTERLQVSQSIRALVLVELQNELTKIHSIAADDREVTGELLLRKGDYVIVPAMGIACIQVTGSYQLLSAPPVHALKDTDRVRMAISTFGLHLESWQADRLGPCATREHVDLDWMPATATASK